MHKGHFKTSFGTSEAYAAEMDKPSLT